MALSAAWMHERRSSSVEIMLPSPREQVTAMSSVPPRMFAFRAMSGGA